MAYSGNMNLLLSLIDLLSAPFIDHRNLNQHHMSIKAAFVNFHSMSFDIYSKVKN